MGWSTIPKVITAVKALSKTGAESVAAWKAKGYAKLSPAVGIGVATSDPVQEARKKKKLKRSK